MAFSLSPANISAILLDIEGTTTPIAFVYDVLFPFARSRVKEYIETHNDLAEVQQDLSRLGEEHAVDLSQGLNPPPLSSESPSAEISSLVAYVHWLMKSDRKSTGLKGLQGKIWERGYGTGELKSVVFPDVPPAFDRWRGAGLSLNIFSSGSILAQKLLFAHTDAGDLTKFLSHYFDTTTGPKIAAESYRRIADTLRQPTATILFISDVVGELDAARSAGMATLLCLRPGNHPQGSTHTHPSIESFSGL